MNDEPQLPDATDSTLQNNAELLGRLQQLEQHVMHLKDTVRRLKKQRPEAPKALEIAPELVDELIKITTAKMNGEKVDKNHPLLVNLREMARYDHTPSFPPFFIEG